MSTPRFQAALELATRLHASQIRKGSGIPYIAHLLGVSSLVMEFGGSEDQAIAGLLHDAVEDQGGRETLEFIRTQFGDEVADIVAACTDALETPKPDWFTRKTRYLEHLPHTTPSARLVSACDKLYNLTAIVRDYRTHGEALWSRFQAGRDLTLWNYRELAQTFKQQGPEAIGEELESLLAELDDLLEDEGKTFLLVTPKDSTRVIEAKAYRGSVGAVMRELRQRYPATGYAITAVSTSSPNPTLEELGSILIGWSEDFGLERD